MGIAPCDLDIKHKCGFCKKKSAGEAWLCRCGVTWHICEVHKHCPTKLGEVKVVGNVLPAKQKLRPSHTFTELVEIGAKKAKHIDNNCINLDKRSADIELGPGFGPCSKRPRVLGPILQKRFGGGLASI